MAAFGIAKSAHHKTVATKPGGSCSAFFFDREIININRLLCQGFMRSKLGGKMPLFRSSVVFLIVVATTIATIYVL